LAYKSSQYTASSIQTTTHIQVFWFGSSTYTTFSIPLHRHHTYTQLQAKRLKKISERNSIRIIARFYPNYLRGIVELLEAAKLGVDEDYWFSGIGISFL
jgi:hypothetical protein